MNKCILIGRLTKDPELKNVGEKGTAICSFTVAVNRTFKKEGEVRQADFILCKAFNHNANHIQKWYIKGQQIGIVGKIQTGSYDKDGQKVYTTEVIVDETYFTGSKQEQKGDAYEPEQTEQNKQGFFPLNSSEDDLPF